MSLNIKSDETHKLVRELAKVTGESMTRAVTEAVRERLKRVRHRGNAALSDRLLRIGKACAGRLKEPYKSVDHGRMLYDDQGLPR